MGVKTGAKRECPNRESKPSAHAPAPHARHDRSMARNRLVAKPILENFLSLRVAPASNAQLYSSMCLLILARKIGFVKLIEKLMAFWLINVRNKKHFSKIGLATERISRH